MVDQVLIRLHAFYPQARGAFTGYEVRRYSTDAGTGGAYLAYGPGQISKYWRLWERPVQRIAFAGEHTDALYPGTLEGALRSGQRAASQVQDLAAGKSFDPAKAAPVAAAAAAGAVAAKDKGGFFSNLFGGSSGKAPAKADAVKAEEAKQDKPGFFSRLFGGGDKPQAKAAPIAKADEVAPVVAPEPEPAPAPVAREEPVKPAASKVAPAKPAQAHKPSAKQAHKPAPVKRPRPNPSL